MFEEDSRLTDEDRAELAKHEDHATMKRGDKVRVIAKDYFEGWEGTIHSVGESHYGVIVRFPNRPDDFDFRPEELEVIDENS